MGASQLIVTDEGPAMATTLVGTPGTVGALLTGTTLTTTLAVELPPASWAVTV
jgi:hypothetical protein